MSVTSYIRELLAKGLDMDQALIAAEVYEANPPKTKAAVRQQRYRNNRNAASRVTHTVTDDKVSPDKEIPPTPPKENKPLPASPIGSATGAEPPSDLDQLQAKLFAAAGIENFRAERSVGLVNLAPMIGLVQQGYDLDRDILPIVENLFRRPKKPNSWAYCVNPIVEAATAKRGIPPKPKAAAIDWPGVLQTFRQHGIWYEQRYGPRPGDPGCRAPPELLVTAA